MHQRRSYFDYNIDEWKGYGIWHFSCAHCTRCALQGAHIVSPWGNTNVYTFGHQQITRSKLWTK
jgi:hypothetical protein